MDRLVELRDENFKRLHISIVRDKFVLPNGDAMTWENVLNESKVKNDETYLIEYGKFRTTIVDAILKYSLELAQCVENCVIQSVGSKNPSSDYDVTVSGPKSADAQQSFNQIFKSLFGQSALIVFDTNVYGASFYEPVKSEDRESCSFAFFPYKSDIPGVRYIKYIALNEIEDVDIDFDQRVWAFVKLLMYLNDEQIGFLKAMITTGPKRFNEYLDLAMAKIIELEDYDESTISRESKYTDSLFAVKSSYAKLREKDTKMTRDGCPMSKAKRDYQNAVSTANYYGWETYLTRGAFFHVVGRMQSKLMELPITANEYMYSYIENIADMFKVINSYDGICSDLITEVSKYYSRALDALHNVAVLLGRDEAIILAIGRLRDSLEEIKIELRGKTPCIDTDNNSSTITTCVLRSTRTKLYTDFLQLQNLDCDNPGRDILREFVKNMFFIYAD